MNRPESDTLDGYVRILRDEMSLGAWVLHVSDDPPEDDDALADIRPTEGRWVAAIRISSSLWTMSAEDQREALVHELLHLTHVRATDAVRLGAYRQQLGQVLYDELVATFKRGIEEHVDFVARLLAPIYPLPPWCEPAEPS